MIFLPKSEDEKIIIGIGSDIEIAILSVDIQIENDEEQELSVTEIGIQNGVAFIEIAGGISFKDYKVRVLSTFENTEILETVIYVLIRPKEVLF